MSETVPSSSTAPPRAQDILAVELATYDRELPRLLAEGAERRWVLIKDSEVVGTWDTFETTIQIAYGRFGHVPFLVQQVLALQPVAQQP